MLLGHPIPFGKHIRSLFYFHDTITMALRRYKTTILSKQSTFLGLYQGAAAAGAENDLRLCARQWRIKKRWGVRGGGGGGGGKRKDLRRLYIRKFSEYFVAFLSRPLFRSISVYVKSQRDIFSFFSRACMRVGRNFLFPRTPRYFARSTVKNLPSSYYGQTKACIREYCSIREILRTLFLFILYVYYNILREILYLILYIIFYLII